ncbi:hypothetical protein A1O3_08108 [Capronia epimyces CBS 606.96]|uniref:Uncharacterized protein n=1 Tax=Capronia epimyces CBS 606.96 TaxID=1182542 RepID=W9XHX0_9EURO|nr:uncharacterized protein A1O3_08108 [Capronia epimyces CBS 606.96]EXJ79823.1 hypothetical protein A1O3_08108 [Capronia epimyces CBS 606.96]
MDFPELEMEERIYARIAARKAMKWSWRRYLLESDESSEGGIPSHSQNRGKESGPWSTPRRQQPVGIGLLNKTLRTTQKTRLPQPSAQDLTRTTGHHAQSSSGSEVRTTSENYGALPSSYRRLRKAKSMLPTHRRTLGSQESPLLTPLGHSRIPRRVSSFAALSTSNFRLRLKRSLTTLRPKSKIVQYSAFTDGPSHDQAVQIARAQFIDEEQQGSERKQPAPLSLKSSVYHKPFSKSLKTSRNQDLDKYPTPTANGVHSPQTELGKRSFSASLRDRLRKALGKSGKDKDGMPSQQLEARKIHFGELAGDTESISGFDAYCADEENQSRRQSVYFPSTPEHDAHEDLDEMPYNLELTASRESLHSNTRSRVTSWTDSSMTGSVGLRSGLIERNRLSIIKEDGGPHQPSSSVGRHIGGVSLFQEPLRSSANEGRSLPPVDSQSVYAALINRINQEEAEVERTRLAFEAIHDENDNEGDNPPGAPGPPTDARPTIRVVHSDSSLATMLLENRSQHFSSRSCSWDQPEGGMTPEQHKENLERRKKRLAAQESQSSFFPFSSEQNPIASSPFQKFLHDRRQIERRSNRGESSDLDGSSVVIPNRESSSYVTGRPHFAVSSDSVYSHTTNGGSCEHYRPPIGSSEELSVPTDAGSEIAGMATILPTVYCRSRFRPLSGTDGHSTGQTNIPDWNPWSDTRQDNEESPPDTHIREPAQIESEEATRSGERAVLETTVQIDHSNDKCRPLNMNVVPKSSTTKSNNNLSARESHTGLLCTTPGDVLHTISNRAEDGRKRGDSLRKLSPSNLAKVLREKKSRIMTRQGEAGKENIPADQSESPPIRTPGKLRLQFRNGNSTGRLRKRASEATYTSHREPHSTPQSAFNSNSTTPSGCEESPSEKAKDHLAARLSRPFNMDVPPHNRPFDSMYLGKRTPGHPDTIGNSRLSVAPRVPPKSDASHVQDSTEHGATGTDTLPSESSTAGRSAAKVLGLLNSKRMVSNFLKSRRKERSASEGGQSVAGESQAFI